MKRLFLSFIAMVALCSSGFGQSNTGNLNVNVSDPAGVIPGATIVITDNQTGRERTVVTSDEGSASIPQLEVGNYTVKVSSQGRKTKIFNDVKIDVGQTYTLNAALEAGNIQETVEVTAGADLINASTGEISTTVGSRQIQELPLNGRNPLSLITLQAGTSSNGATNTVINGQRSSFTNITRDGLNIQDNFIRANATDFVPDRPNTDDVGEFTITNQNAGVEQGYGASQVQLATPRGSNNFTGSLYIYNRNSEFAANSFFNNRTDIERPFLNRNQFGGRAGGPIWKNRLFFFGAYEGFRLRQSSSVTRTVLTPSARQGIFTYLDSAGATRTINLFTATQQVPAGGTPITGIDPVIQSRILANLPAGNNTLSGGDNLNTVGYTFSQKQNQDREAITTRFDFDLNAQHSFSSIYSWRDEFLLRPDVDNGGYSDIPFGFQVAKTYTTNSSWRWTPTGRFTNEVRGALQLSRPAFDRNDQATNFFVVPTLVSSPESTFQTQGRDTAIWNLQDNAVYTWGNHSIRFGGQINWFRINPFGPPSFANSTIPTVNLGTNANTPQFTAAAFPGGISTGQLGTANALLALLGGIVSSANQTFNVVDQTSGFKPDTLPNRRLHYEHYSFYVGDQWRVNQQLTVNYGVRYENFTPLSEPDGLALEPVIGNGQSIRDAILNPNGTYNFVGTNFGDNRFFKPDKNNFAPNFSVAWSPKFGDNFLGRLFPGEGKTVIRGGLSVSYVNDEFVRAADNALSGNAGLTQQVSRTNLNQRLSTFANPVTAPAFQVPRTYAQNNALAGNFGTVFAINPELEVPSLLQYNFGIQRELPWKMALEIRYVGNKSDNLVRGLDYNQVNIRSNGFLTDFNRAVNNLRVNEAERSRLFNQCLANGGTQTSCTTQVNNQLPNSAGFNPNLPGSTQLTILNNLPNGGLIGVNPATGALIAGNATILNLVRSGAPGQLAFTYITNPALFPNVSPLFLANPNTGVVDELGNYARSKYDSLQIEVRRRFSDGFYFQANYTLQKALTDAAGTGQTRFDPLIDNENRGIEYARADFDTEHVFNLNTIYELPFGRGRRFLNQGGVADFFLGGWQLTSIIRATTGTPIFITDPRGTLNRDGRSGRQTANSNLTNEEISNLIGIYRTPCGIFWINPAVININQANLAAGNCSALGSGRAAEGFGTSPFSGQVFFNVNPGETGNMARNAWNGPFYFNWDASMMKNFRIRENMRLQVRAEAFNVLNRANFFASGGNINSATFGRVTSTFSPRILQFVARFEF